MAPASPCPQGFRTPVLCCGRHFARYDPQRSGFQLSYWRSTSGYEVDFIIGDHTAVEVKAKSHVTANDLKGLRALAEEKKLRELLCLSLEPRARETEGIRILPWAMFLEALWSGEFD